MIYRIIRNIFLSIHIQIDAFIYIFKQSITLSMNPDYTSDLLLTDRFIFNHEVYLLSMFDKKMQKLSTNQSKQISEKDLFDSRRPINPQDFYQNMIKKLAKDKTKPIWDCQTTFQPRIVLRQSSIEQNGNTFNAMDKLLKRYFVKFRNEHEDESNLSVDIRTYDLQGGNRRYNESKDINLIEKSQQLFNQLEELASRTLAHVQSQSVRNQEHTNNSYVTLTMKATLQLCKHIRSGQGQNLKKQLSTLIQILFDNVKKVYSSEIGALLFALQSKLLHLPLLLHPMIICLHHIIKTQTKDILHKIDQKNKNKQYPNNLQTTIDPIIKSSPFKSIFEEQKIDFCSKFVFINFDAFQSEFNIDIAQSISKHLMYVSFPIECSKTQQNNLNGLINQRSEHLLRKYYRQGLSEQEKQYLLSYYYDNQSTIRNNLYIFPLFSQYLSAMHPEIHQISDCHHSQFINFMMKQVIYSNIAEFGPECIIISYSPKSRLSNQHFSEIIRELTISGNYRIIMYVNLSHNSMLEQQIKPQFNYSKKYMQIQSKILDIENLFKCDVSSLPQFNLDIFQKMSIMLKIGSGTYNLSKNQIVQKDHLGLIEKYKNFKAMTFAYNLIKFIGPEFHHLSKLRIRMNSYSTVINVLNKYFNEDSTFQKMFIKVISKFHQNVIKHVTHQCLNFNNTNKMQDETVSHQSIEIQEQLTQLLQKLSIKQNLTKILQDIKFQYYLQLSTMETQSSIFARIPPFSTTGNKKDKSHVLCLEFEVEMIREQKICKIPVLEIAQYTQIHYTNYMGSTRKNCNVPILLINHLLKQNSTQMTSYYGQVTQVHDSKAQPKVKLTKLSFEGTNLSSYQNYTQFNFHQSPNYLFLYWPKLYDHTKQLLHKIMGTKYHPESTSLFFRSSRKNRPEVFVNCNLYMGNLYAEIIPRHGCTSYEVQNTNTIYIFGGIYSDTKNYLKFQIDITVMKYKEQSDDNNFSLHVMNVPQQFFFESHKKQDNPNVSVIDSIKNDFIRPKIQYEILQDLQPHQMQSNNMETKTIYLVGGVGQKFVRSFSFFTKIVNRITFEKTTGVMLRVERLNKGTISPINVRGAVQTRNPIDLNVVKNAQNRRINLIEDNIGSRGQIFSYNRIQSLSQNSPSMNQSPLYITTLNLTSQTIYNFAAINRRNTREQLQSFKKSISDPSIRNHNNLPVKCYRSKHNNINFVTIIREHSNIKQTFELKLKLTSKVRELHPEEPPAIRLTQTSIISLDISDQSIFALIKHQSFTLDKCIIAYYDIGEIKTYIQSNQSKQIHLRQLYQFDKDFSQNILIAANSYTIAVLHGYKFVTEDQQNPIIPELLIHQRKNQIRAFQVQNGDLIDKHQQIMQPGENQKKWISSSFFLNRNNGTVLCLSFRTVRRKEFEEVVYVIPQIFIIGEYKWKLLSNGRYLSLKINQQEIDEHIQSINIQMIFQNHVRRKKILKLLEVSQNQSHYELLILYNTIQLRGKVMKNILTPTTDQSKQSQTEPVIVELQIYQNERIEQSSEIYKGSCKEHSVSLYKNHFLYQQLIKSDGMEDENK